MQDVLHWFPFSQQIVFQIAALVWCYLQDLAQAYLAVPPQVPEVAAPSAAWIGVTPCTFHPYFHKAEPCLLGGTVFQWCCDCSPGSILAHFHRNKTIKKSQYIKGDVRYFPTYQQEDERKSRQEKFSQITNTVQERKGRQPHSRPEMAP